MCLARATDRQQKHNSDAIQKSVTSVIMTVGVEFLTCKEKNIPSLPGIEHKVE